MHWIGREAMPKAYLYSIAPRIPPAQHRLVLVPHRLYCHVRAPLVRPGAGWLVGWSLGEGRVKTSSGTNVVSRGRLGRVFCPLGRRLVSFWGSAEVICAPLWLKSCHDEARCGQVRARRADGCARTSETHIKPMYFDGFGKPRWAP